MANNKPVTNKLITDSSMESGKKKISRRNVMKGLLLIPVQWSIYQAAIRAQGVARALSVEAPPPKESIKKIFNANYLEDIYTPNQPMGKPQGIMPGRVSWVWNPASTNPDCVNKPVSGDMSEEKYDAWFMDKNTNQEVVDNMLIAGLCSITGKKKIEKAWDAIFRYHNQNRGKGNVSYRKGEKIYIKLNRTSASNGINTQYERVKSRPVALSFETSPQVVLSVLRQLVHVVKVPQELIYVGDAMRNIYQDEYVKYYAEFPHVNYLSSFDSTHGRIKSSESSKDLIFYSDKKTVMKEAGSDKIYSVLEECEYLINPAAMKGHSSAGISLCTKNHFGSQSRNSAFHLHPGLNSSDRIGYGHYRVLVDLMGNRFTGGKNLFYMLDALWAGPDWNGLPVKFLMPPFNNHWSSSLLFSLDPVAIESVAFDFLRTEFTNPEHTYSFVSEDGVDDYLHQAADSKNWPSGIIYAPNGDGIALPKSMGVHEHWDNPVDKRYSKNLGTGEGIELVKIFQNV